MPKDGEDVSQNDLFEDPVLNEFLEDPVAKPKTVPHREDINYRPNAYDTIAGINDHADLKRGWGQAGEVLDTKPTNSKVPSPEVTPDGERDETSSSVDSDQSSQSDQPDSTRTRKVRFRTDYLEVLVDRSGSMGPNGIYSVMGRNGKKVRKNRNGKSLIPTLAKSVNKFINDQQQIDDIDCHVTVSAFDATVQILRDDSIKNVVAHPLTKDELETGNGTSVMLAIYEAIRRIEERCPDEETASTRTVVIMTDGEDTKSSVYRWSKSQVKKVRHRRDQTGCTIWELKDLIKQKLALPNSYNFQFLGAGINAKDIGRAFGIPYDCCLPLDADAEKVEQAMQIASNNLTMTRTGQCAYATFTEEQCFMTSTGYSPREDSESSEDSDIDVEHKFYQALSEDTEESRVRTARVEREGWVVGTLLEVMRSSGKWQKAGVIAIDPFNGDMMTCQFKNGRASATKPAYRFSEFIRPCEEPGRD